MDIETKLFWTAIFLSLFFTFAVLGTCALQNEPTAPECRRYYQQGIVHGCDKCKANMQPLQVEQD